MTAKVTNPDLKHRNEIEVGVGLDESDGTASETAWLRDFKQVKADTIKSFMKQIGFPRIPSISKEAMIQRILKYKREGVYHCERE